jgi:hypothetical protein
VLVAFYAALTHKRFLFLAGIVACPVLSVELAGAVFEPYDTKRDKPLLNAIIMVAFCTFAIRHTPTSAALRNAEGKYFPADAMRELQRCCTQGHLLNRYEWGGYLIWNERDTQVFVDSRTDIFEYHGVLFDYLKAVTLDDSLAVLNRYHIDSVLQQPTAPIVYLLRHTPGWRVRYEDTTAVLLVRERT